MLDRGQLVHGPVGETWMDGVIFDITERRAAEAELRRREAEAARTAELRASRRRVVAAADAARRRIERDLHDGAQQQLVAVALGLRVAQAKLASDPAGAAPILAQAIDQLAHAHRGAARARPRHPPGGAHRSRTRAGGPGARRPCDAAGGRDRDAG